MVEYEEELVVVLDAMFGGSETWRECINTLIGMNPAMELDKEEEEWREHASEEWEIEEELVVVPDALAENACGIRKPKTKNGVHALPIYSKAHSEPRQMKSTNWRPLDQNPK